MACRQQLPGQADEKPAASTPTSPPSLSSRPSPTRGKLRTLSTLKRTTTELRTIYGADVKPCERTSSHPARSRRASVEAPWQRGMSRGKLKLSSDSKGVRLMLHPDGRVRRSWDAIQALLLLYVAAVVPFRLGFDVIIAVGSAAFWLDAAVDLYFLADVLLNFRTGYVESGRLVLNPQRVAKRYARSWLVVDIIACAPIDYIALLISSTDPSAGQTRGVKTLRLCRIARLLRLARIRRLIKRWQARDGSEVAASLVDAAKLCGLLLVIIFMTHVRW